MTKFISKKIVHTSLDPDGFTVHLEKECWYGHILKRHKTQMLHRLYDVKTTIEKPDELEDRVEYGVRNRVYYKHWKDRDPFGQPYLKVATEVVGDKISRVLTAHPTPIIFKRRKKP